MRILAVGDVVDPLLYAESDQSRWQQAGVSAVISCGDLPPDYLCFLAGRFQAPLFYVLGNHNGSYRYNPPAGCVSIDGRLLRWQGLRLLGVGGAPPHNGGSEQYSERAMALRLLRHRAAIWRQGAPDLVISHAPPRFSSDQPPRRNRVTTSGDASGTPHSNAPDPGHRGFLAFGNLIRRSQPRFWLHGHTHLAYGTSGRESQVGSTRVINVYGHCLIEL